MSNDSCISCNTLSFLFPNTAGSSAFNPKYPYCPNSKWKFVPASTDTDSIVLRAIPPFENNDISLSLELSISLSLFSNIWFPLNSPSHVFNPSALRAFVTSEDCLKPNITWFLVNQIVD